MSNWVDTLIKNRKRLKTIIASINVEPTPYHEVVGEKTIAFIQHADTFCTVCLHRQVQLTEIFVYCDTSDCSMYLEPLALYELEEDKDE